ncbi:MAG: helix-turn-helix domain-containing protein [Vulcanimicrobiota bacterium]
MQSFHEKLKNRRKDLGLSQRELSRRLEIESRTVARWEKGTLAPAPEELRRLCAALGVSARFFDDTDWEPPESYPGMVFW